MRDSIVFRTGLFLGWEKIAFIIEILETRTNFFEID